MSNDADQVSIMDLNAEDALLKIVRNDVLFKFMPGAFPKVATTLGPSKIVFIRLHNIGLSGYRESTYGAKTTRTVTLRLDAQTLSVMKEVEEALKNAALRLGKINNKKITRDVLDNNFRSRLYEHEDNGTGTFTVTCGDHITFAQTDDGKEIDFEAIQDFFSEHEKLQTIRLAVQPTYLWSQTPMKIGISWELKVMVLKKWPIPTEEAVKQQKKEIVLPDLDDLTLDA